MSKKPAPLGGEDGEATTIADAPQRQGEPARKTPSPWLAAGDHAPRHHSATIDGKVRPRRSSRAALLPGRIVSGRWLPLAAAALATAAVLSSSVHLLGHDQQGAVLTLGRHTRDVGPGLAVTMPWPLETVRAYRVGTAQALTLPARDRENLMPTRDGQLIDVAVKVRWKVTDLDAFAFNLKDPVAAIEGLADAETRAAIAELPFDPVWDGSRRAEAALRVRQRMQAALDAWHAGAAIEAVEITRANPPGQLADSFLKVSEAHNEARQHREKAEEWAARTINNAHAEAQDFDRIYQQYLAAPEITRRRMYYETMERVISNNDRVIVGGSAASTPITVPPSATPPKPAPPQEGQ